MEHCNFTNGEDLTFSIKTKRFPVCFHVQAGEVVKFRCKIDETQKTVHVPNSWRTKPIVEKSVTPLVAARTELQPWSILPIKYGIADYDNVEKKTMHVLTQDSKLAFYRYNSTDIKKGDFISFREYSEQKKDEVVYNVVDVSRCDRNEVLPNFKSRIVVVDDVNEQKKLFHVVLGPNLISDIVRYEETNIRPSIGDFLKIIYIVKTNKEGKKHIKFLDIQNTTEGCNGVRGTVTGKLEVKYKDESWRYEDDEDNALPDFAFVKDFYVHRKLLRKYNITKDCDVIAKVVLGGDNK